MQCFRSPTWILSQIRSQKDIPTSVCQTGNYIEIERFQDIEAVSHAFPYNRLRTVPVQLLIDTERIYVSFVDKLRGQWKEEKSRSARA